MIWTVDLVTLKIANIHPYERNARKNDHAVDSVAESIRQCEYVAPIVVDENHVILAGHTRWKALKKLGRTDAECVVKSGLTDEQKRKYRLLDNKTAELADWDFDLLADELEGLDFDGFDFGFDLPDEDAAEIVEDEPPEVNETAEPKAKLGDIYQLGRHRLMCGDSTSAENVARLMGGQKADMVFTDPPYNIASDSKNFAADVSKSMGTLSKSEWDKDFDISGLFPILESSLAENFTVYICTSHFLAPIIWQWMKGWADHYSYCVWSKPNPMPSLSKRHWTWNTELICYATKGKHTFNFPKEGHALSTWTIAKKNGESGHPTEKPVEVPAMAIQHSSKVSNVILDLFGGSGSTLMACEQLDRTCYMMELDTHYVDVIIERWEKFTGQKAVKVV